MDFFTGLLALNMLTCQAMPPWCPRCVIGEYITRQLAQSNVQTPEEQKNERESALARAKYIGLYMERENV